MKEARNDVRKRVKKLQNKRAETKEKNTKLSRFK